MRFSSMNKDDRECLNCGADYTAHLEGLRCPSSMEKETDCTVDHKDLSQLEKQDGGFRCSKCGYEIKRQNTAINPQTGNMSSD